MTTERVNAIRRQLEELLAPVQLDIEDESDLHAGHPGARDGRGHFRVRIVSEKFTGQPPLKRHRLVYQALAELLKTDIHALSIEALTPDE